MFDFLLEHPHLFYFIEDLGPSLGLFGMMYVALSSFSRLRTKTLACIDNPDKLADFDHKKDFAIGSYSVDVLLFSICITLVAVGLNVYQNKPLSNDEIHQAKSFYEERPQVIQCLQQKTLLLKTVLRKKDLLDCAISRENHEEAQKAYEEEPNRSLIFEQKKALQSEPRKVY